MMGRDEVPSYSRLDSTMCLVMKGNMWHEGQTDACRDGKSGIMESLGGLGWRGLLEVL